MIQKFKHYATGEIVKVNVSDGVGFVNGKYFDIVRDKHDRSQLKGTSYFEIVETVISHSNQRKNK